MGKKTIIFRLTVPSWFPTGSQWWLIKATYNTLKYQLNPFKCMDCGGKINYKFPEFHYTIPGKNRMMLRMSGHNLEKTDHQGCCGNCTSKRIHTLFARIKPLRGTLSNGLNRTGTRKAKCDGCNLLKPTLTVSWDKECDIRFGSRWWNGHTVCEDCLCETAEKGRQTNGISMYHNGKSYDTNEARAVIGLEHWYDLLRPYKPLKKVEK